MTDFSQVNNFEPKPLNSVTLHSLNADEKWLQEAIIENPDILGLGDDVEVRDIERKQPTGGRIDLVLESGNKRFELELQLGMTDANHIIRTIEYWDIERRRYPKFEHTAVIAAEEITGRFFNVINVFGYHIPIVAIKVSAFKLEEGIGLHFTKVLDTREIIAQAEEEETVLSTTRDDWIDGKYHKEVSLVDTAVNEITGGTPNYRRYYIGFKLNGRNHAKVRFGVLPGKIDVNFRVNDTDAVPENLEELPIFDGINKYGWFVFYLENETQLRENLPILKKMFKLAMGEDDGNWPSETDIEQTHENEAGLE